MFRFLLALGLIFWETSAFSQMTARRPVVRASGTGVVSVKPDQVKISVGVTTTGETAQDASDRNAAQTTEVINALRQLLGANADIKTLNYTLSQTRDRNNQPTGFSVSNTVQVTSSDLNGAGRVIDTATKAGATVIYGLSFSLKDPQPARQQALRLATMQAKVSTEAIASGLGMRVGNVMVAEQGGSISQPFTDTRLAAGAGTPIEVGNVEVNAIVTIEAELIP
ncbi:MAG TPA: SIMPL domain-containing protein [Bryobacteraceae bacterium]|nr:SIMPL domain-containing protein [Bryobacteraceae bacterium]